MKEWYNLLISNPIPYHVEVSMSLRDRLQALLENEKFKVDRLVCNIIDRTLLRKECVTLLGPRQIGKTTLAKSYYKTQLNAVYRDLEERTDREEVGSGRVFFEQHKDRIIVLDEIQECAYLFSSIKFHIDEQRFAENTNCRFLLLGSASLDLQQKSVASLVGRVSFKEMTGILLPELTNSMSEKMQAPSGVEMDEYHKSLTELLMFRGGMPLSLFARTDEDSLIERSEMILSSVLQDIEKYGLNVDRITLERCLDFLSKVNGTQFEIGTFTKGMRTSGQKVQDSLSALEQLLMLRVIEPWNEYNGRYPKVSKHTKVYIRDSGLLASLLNIKNTQHMLDGNHIGSIWESFVIESLVGTAQAMGIYRNCFYYRTHKGERELDLILEFSDRSTWGIEIKYSEPKMLNGGNIAAAETVGVRKRLAIHNGTNSYKINGGFEAMPLYKALEKLLEWNSKRKNDKKLQHQ